MKKSFKVTMTVPSGATVTQCQRYIEDAVTSWKGSLRPPGAYGDEDPGDPMWGLIDVKVTRLL